MKRLIVPFFIAMCCPAHAGVVIYGTRVIYPADKNEVVVQIMNQGTRSSLVQAWIDDGDTTKAPEQIDVPFLLTPPVSRLAATAGQQLKIKKIASQLPNDKESLFFLNVLDIPPNDARLEGKNVIKFATQNRIKLFWRPSGIPAVSKESFQRLSLSKTVTGVGIKNDNANWITITEVSANGRKINQESIMLAPRSMLTVPSQVSNLHSAVLTMVDDYGNYLSEKLNIK
jgi:P pilus assembly protein, chaperone PapD